MIKNPKTPEKIEVLRRLFRADMLIWLVVLLMLVTLFRWLYFY